MFVGIPNLSLLRFFDLHSLYDKGGIELLRDLSSKTNCRIKGSKGIRQNRDKLYAKEFDKNLKVLSVHLRTNVCDTLTTTPIPSIR